MTSVKVELRSLLLSELFFTKKLVLYQVVTLRQRLISVQEECAKVEEQTLIEKINELNIDDNLRENIVNCVKIAKAATANGNRYSPKWLYECILLKIKNTMTYEHIRRHKLMPLPCPSTIHRYLRKLKPTYGFQTAIFDMMKKKAHLMTNMEKEGNYSLYVHIFDEFSSRRHYFLML